LLSREAPGELDDRRLAHAEHKDVGAAVKKYGAPHIVFPVIIMGKTPERGLQAAEHYRKPGKSLADEPGIHRRRSIRAAPGLFPRRIVVLLPGLLCGRIARDHGI
jgi:hypothetical protein